MDKMELHLSAQDMSNLEFISAIIMAGMVSRVDTTLTNEGLQDSATLSAHAARLILLECNAHRISDENE